MTFDSQPIPAKPSRIRFAVVWAFILLWLGFVLFNIVPPILTVLIALILGLPSLPTIIGVMCTVWVILKIIG